jgi:hypothetical protein
MSLTGGNGGYLVPFTLDPTIVLNNAGAANPFRQISRIATTATNSWNGAAKRLQRLARRRCIQRYP